MHSFLCIKDVQSNKNLRSESVETVIPHMATYEVPLLPSPNEGEDPVRTHTIIPN